MSGHDDAGEPRERDALQLLWDRLACEPKRSWRDEEDPDDEIDDLARDKRECVEAGTLSGVDVDALPDDLVDAWCTIGLLDRIEDADPVGVTIDGLRADQRDRLRRRWRINVQQIAQSVARALELAGVPFATRAERFYRLGRAVDRQICLARGLTWANGHVPLWDELARDPDNTLRVVLIGREPAGLLALDRIEYVSIADVVRWDGSAIVAIDGGRRTGRSTRARGKGPLSKKREPCTGVVPFALPAGATLWTKVEAEIGAAEITLRVGENSKSYTLRDAGFAKGNSSATPTTAWALLRSFAAGPVDLQRVDPSRKNDQAHVIAVKRCNETLWQQLSDLREKLQCLFPTLSDDPIHFDDKRRRYALRFKIGAAVTPQAVHWPAHAQWQDVTISLLAGRRILVSVRDPAQPDRHVKSELEIAELCGAGENETLRRAIEHAMIELIRNDGDVKGSIDDGVMRELSRVIERYVPLNDGNAITFAPAQSVWTAIFHVDRGD